MIVFGTPAAALLFILLPLISLIWYWKGYRLKKLLNHWISSPLQSQLATTSSRHNNLTELFIWNIFAGLVIFALMDPRGNPRYLTKEKVVETPSNEVIFLIDASASMNATDTRTGQSRFEIGKEIAQQTIEQLQGSSVSLFAFTSQLTPLSPPTLDLLFVHMMLQQMQINEGDVSGTDLYTALNELIPTLSQRTTPKTVVLISDGENTLPETKDAITATLDKIIQLNTTVEVIGIGSSIGGVVPGVTYNGKPVVSIPDEQLLQQVAARGRGNYLKGSSSSSLALATELASAIRDGSHGALISGAATQSEILYDHYRFYPLCAALVLLLIYRFFSWTRVFVWMILTLPTLSAETPFTHALYQLQAEDFPQAIREWGALAATSKSPWERGVSLYNLSCAYIAQEKWQDAFNTLQLIPLTQETPAYLTYHVLWNKAWVNFKLKNSQQTTLEMISQSKTAYCDWLKAIGAADCTPPARYETFERIALSTPSIKPAKRTFISNPDPVNILIQLIALQEAGNISEVLFAAAAFEERSLSLQKEKFFESCQFHPWNEVYPPFFEAVTLGKKDPNDPTLQAKALVKYKEALSKLTQPPEKFKGSCWEGTNANILQQLQSMNQSDTQQKKPQKVKGGNKPW